jgi:hypothetical protein
MGQSDRPLIAYPFVLGDGQLAKLTLPAHGLTSTEAERLTALIGSLVIEPEPSSQGRSDL